MIPNFYPPFYMPPYHNSKYNSNEKNDYKKTQNPYSPNVKPTFTQKNNSHFESDSDFFEILGLKLYFDDLLIIALLICLYNEDVKDTCLYIALILLLLS